MFARTLALLVLLALPARAQDAPSLGRDALASWYLDVDAAWAAARAARSEMPAAEVRRANTEFDRATLAFFRLAFADAVGSLRDLAARISQPNAAPPGDINQPMLMEAAPQVWVRGSPPPRLTVRSIKTFAGPAQVKDTFQLLASLASPTATAAANAPVSVEALPGQIIVPDLTSAMTDLAATVAGVPGRWRLSLLDSRGVPFAAETIWVVDAPLSPVREANEKRLQALADNTALAASVRIAAGRNKLLTDTPSRSVSSEFLADYSTLPAQLEQEIAALEAGINPYPLAGPWWFSLGGPTVPVGAPPENPATAPSSIPCWVQFSPSKNKAAKSPLIIALHGAGGDESMFFRGYGAGAITRLTCDDGLVIASPLTGSMMTNPANFDRLVKTLAEWYPIDLDRIYVMGHSMGAGAASNLSQRRASKIAASVCFAGGQIMKEKAACPVLVIAGGLDPVIPAARLRPMAETARQAGLPVEYREKPEAGHTLIVGDHLNEALEWLLQHKRQPQPAQSP